MNPVTGLEDELLHLGIPSFSLVSEMDAGVQQFFNADTEHSFPLVRSPLAHAGEPSRGTRDYFKCCYGPLHSSECRHLRPFSQWAGSPESRFPSQSGNQGSKPDRFRNL